MRILLTLLITALLGTIAVCVSWIMVYHPEYGLPLIIVIVLLGVGYQVYSSLGD